MNTNINIKKYLLLFKFTVWTIGTKAEQIVLTDYFFQMPILTVGYMPTKTSVVPWTVFDLGLSIQVKKFAFFITTLTVFGIEITFRHFAHVIFMQKFAFITFLTKTTQPMFANHRFITFLRLYIYSDFTKIY